MPRGPMTEADKQHLRDVWAEKKARKSRTDQAIEHVASGVLRGELDEIETAIDRRESKLSRLKTDEEVAAMRVVASNAELQKVNTMIAKAKESLENQLRVGDNLEKNYRSRISDSQRDLRQVEATLSHTAEDLEGIKREISERLSYKEQQEREIEEVFNKGNDRLYEVDQEVKEELRKRDGIHQEIADLEQQKSALDIECAATEAKLVELKRRYDHAAEKYRDDLMAIRVSVTEEQENVNALQDRAKEITNDLVTKGKAAIARENAIASREAELTSRERLLKSRESRYS